MKKRRRIEITTFRSRTTMIVRNQPEGDPVEPLHNADTSGLAPANLPKAEEVDLKQHQVAQPLPLGSNVIKLTK